MIYCNKQEKSAALIELEFLLEFHLEHWVELEHYRTKFVTIGYESSRDGLKTYEDQREEFGPHFYWCNGPSEGMVDGEENDLSAYTEALCQIFADEKTPLDKDYAKELEQRITFSEIRVVKDDVLGMDALASALRLKLAGCGRDVILKHLKKLY